VAEKRTLPGEFELIARYFAPLAANAPGALGLTDDAFTFLPPAANPATLSYIRDSEMWIRAPGK